MYLLRQACFFNWRSDAGPGSAKSLPIERGADRSTVWRINASSADSHLIRELASLAFTDTAQNVVLIGVGPGTGKTHLATALASGITLHGKRVRFYSTVDLANLLEREKHDGKAGRISVSRKPSERRWHPCSL